MNFSNITFNSSAVTFVQQEFRVDDLVRDYCSSTDATIFWLLVFFWCFTLIFYIVRERELLKKAAIEKVIGVYMRFFLVLIGYAIYLLWLRL